MPVSVEPATPDFWRIRLGNQSPSVLGENDGFQI